MHAVDFFHIKNRHREGKVFIFAKPKDYTYRHGGLSRSFEGLQNGGWALNQESPHLIHPWKIGGWAFARTWAYTPESTVGAVVDVEM